MSAFRGKNLRSGDLAEQLGLLLLQNLALVAPIPRTEDIGIDAVVTLIRDYDSYRYVAEDSFFVQIKSASVLSINYSKDQVKWLYALELPFFIASVDRHTSRVKLFCAHRLSDALVTNHDRDSIVIFLDNLNTDDEIVEADDNEIHIGPPILEWSMDDLEKDINLPNRFYQIIKSHINIYKSSLKTRDIGWIEYTRWNTNELPKKLGTISSISRPPIESLTNAYNEMMPYFVTWQQELIRTGKWSLAEDVISLLEKTEIIIKRQKSYKKEII